MPMTRRHTGSSRHVISCVWALIYHPYMLRRIQVRQQDLLHSIWISRVEPVNPERFEKYGRPAFEGLTRKTQNPRLVWIGCRLE